MEKELAELQEKVRHNEEMKLRSNIEFTDKIRELENKLRALELEKDQLVASMEHLKQRHKQELDALEASHKYEILLQVFSLVL